MSTDATSVAVAALLDAVALLHGQIASLARNNERIEATQRDILHRLDTIDSGQAAATDIVPILESILGRVIESREATQTGYNSVVTVMTAIAGGMDNHHQNTLDGFAGVVPLLEQIASSGKTGAVPDAMMPAIEKILTGQLEDRKLVQTGFAKTISMSAFSYAAASGQRPTLPVDLAGDPLLERYILAQPADYASTDRALVDWRRSAAAASTAELITLLERQYEPSPTDTPETRVLRYRLAAITRAEIKGRGGDLPAPPTTIVARDRSAVACLIRSQELAALWRAGESTALDAEPELAGALDLFDEAERRMGATVGEDVPPELVELHQELALLIETNHRPSSADTFSPDFGECLKSAGIAKAIESGVDRC